ncbi:unnamed protein product [Soboliphyme baturini]|uniref:Endonuclease n=1 Tax=Soboliphyme baturini TaxID=241478 RepID=A0A183IZB3_9BILA|nr:unnamed protein product [Soboliphyme baturini]
MEVCDYWLQDKELIRKLFEVYVPRYRSYRTAFTDLYQLPPIYGEFRPGRWRTARNAVLELKAASAVTHDQLLRLPTLVQPLRNWRCGFSHVVVLEKLLSTPPDTHQKRDHHPKRGDNYSRFNPIHHLDV